MDGCSIGGRSRRRRERNAVASQPLAVDANASRAWPIPMTARLRKLLSADSAATGATGRPFGFSFSKGRNAHFPETGRRFSEGVKRYLGGGGEGQLPAAEVSFPPYGDLVILGKLTQKGGVR